MRAFMPGWRHVLTSARSDKALHDLHRLIRRPPSGTEQAMMTRRLPYDLATTEHRFIRLMADEVCAPQTATATLLEDLRFEHLDHAEIRPSAGCRDRSAPSQTA
jgi:hypothetical protein